MNRLNDQHLYVVVRDDEHICWGENNIHDQVQVLDRDQAKKVCNELNEKNPNYKYSIYKLGFSKLIVGAINA